MAQVQPAKPAESAPPPDAGVRPATPANAAAFAEATRDLPMKPLPLVRIKLIRANEANFASLHGVILPNDVKFDAVFDPAFWSLIAPRLNAGDQIEIHRDNGATFARLLVRLVGGSGGLKTWAHVAVLEHVNSVHWNRRKR
jgi:hypothetical protein